MKGDIKEVRKQKFTRRQERFNEDMDMFWRMRGMLDDMEANQRKSPSYRLLEAAIDTFGDQIRNDFYNFEGVCRRAKSRDNEVDLQQALNRERTKRAELENQVKEASESSGLFISYVRKKLKL